MDASAFDTCRTWFASTVDRLPAAVAAVRYEPGRRPRGHGADAEDGFVVLNVLGSVPDGVTSDVTEWASGCVTSTRSPRSPTWTPPGSPSRPRAADAPAGLPKLKAYPSLKGAEIY